MMEAAAAAGPRKGSWLSSEPSGRPWGWAVGGGGRHQILNGPEGIRLSSLLGLLPHMREKSGKTELRPREARGLPVGFEPQA